MFYVVGKEMWFISFPTFLCLAKNRVKIEKVFETKR